jgi:hypothetical protein
VPNAGRNAIRGIGHRFFSWILRWQVVAAGWFQAPSGCALYIMVRRVCLEPSIFGRRVQFGCSSAFVAKGEGTNYLNCLDGDVAERLKAAVC